jgi:hypothetical protein
MHGPPDVAGEYGIEGRQDNSRADEILLHRWERMIPEIGVW